MDVITDKDVFRAVWSDLDDEFRRRLTYMDTPSGVGRVNVFFYWILGGRYHPMTASKLGRATGATSRIIDDLLDGEGTDPVTDRERFLENYIEAVRNGTMPDSVEIENEWAAYRAGRVVYDFFKQYPSVHSDIIDTLQSMEYKAIKENKSNKADYLQYVEGAGADHCVIMLEANQILPDFEVDESKKEFVRAFGRVGQIADDIFDGDTELKDADIREVYQEKLEELQQYGDTKSKFVACWLMKNADIITYLGGAKRLQRKWNSLRGRL